ncbi:MAG: signal peptidase II [Myxococcales bacterium 68-20]|nr:MAG: signal peptidase II [Myxococcales bacterium 68-20]
MNESSRQDAAPDEASTTATPTSTETEGAVSGEGSTTSAAAALPADPPAVEEPPIAPGVERLGRPAGTSQAIPETMLGHRPSPMFLVVVALVSLVSDVGTKLWAEQKLADYPGYVTVIENHLMFVLAKNKGGAWGLLQGESENVRRPFFLLVSVAAIAFIVTLYRRLQPRQYALKWGLPLVLGGALGNVFDRVRYGYVIDFIDYRADWIRSFNELIGKYYPRHVVTDHWPTFNVADIAICVGVALMAIDMLTSRRGSKPPIEADVPIEPALEPLPAGEGAALSSVAGDAVVATDPAMPVVEGDVAPADDASAQPKA